MGWWSRLWGGGRKREHPAWDAIYGEFIGVDVGGGVGPIDQDYKQFLRALGIFPLVAAAVDKIKAAAADVPLIVCNPDGTVNEDHPLNELFRRPNPSPNGGHTAFFQNSYQQILLTGTLNWAVDNTMEDPRALWLLESSRTDPIPSKSMAFPYVAYTYEGAAVSKRIPADRVLRMIRPHPYDPLAGLSPLKELEPTLELMWDQRKANQSIFKNGLKIGGILALKGNTRYSEEEKEALRRKIESRHQGSQNAGRLLVLSTNDAELMRDQASPREMEGAAMYEILRREVFNVLQVPPGLFDSKDVNRSNMKEQRALLYTDAVRPIVTLVTDAINGSELSQGMTIKADWTSVEALQPNRLELMQVDTGYVNAGIQTVNEIRELRGLGEPLEGGDEPKGGGATPPQLAPFTGEENGNGNGAEAEEEEEEVGT